VDEKSFPVSKVYLGTASDHLRRLGWVSTKHFMPTYLWDSPETRERNNAHKAARALTLVGGPAVDVHKVQIMRANVVRQAAVRLAEGEWKEGKSTVIHFSDRVFMKVCANVKKVDRRLMTVFVE
jgi:hypothetical protein